MAEQDTPDDMDALFHSFCVQSAASGEGFDWDHVDGVLAKIAEELCEIREALAASDRAHARRELGDLLLAAVNLSRFLDADPRVELNRATERFATRFGMLKSALASEGRGIKSCTAGELESCWQGVKPKADKLLKKGLDMHRDDGANSSSNLYKSPVFKGQNESVDNL